MKSKARDFLSLLEGKSDYVIYHDTYTSAVKEAEEFAEKNGYTLDKEQVVQDVGINTRRPKDGETVRFSLDLYKNDKLQKKRLHAQVYGRGTTKSNFELNMYIS